MPFRSTTSSSQRSKHLASRRLYTYSLTYRCYCRASTGNTFTFPDSSDIEDEDYDFSDMEEGEQPSSEDGVSVESQSLKSSRAISAIDLTRDDSPVTSSAPIDLTGETPAEKRLMDLMAGRPGDIDDNADPVSNAVYAGNGPILVTSDDEGEEAHFSSDSDDSGSSDICGMENTENSETGDANDDVPMDGIVEEGQETHHLNNIERYTLATHDNHPVILSDLRTRIEASENIMDDDDNQSDFDLSEAGAAGIRALLEDGLLQNHENHSFFSEDENESSSVGPPSDDVTGLEISESPKHVTFARLPSEEASEMTSNFSLCQKKAVRAPVTVGDTNSQIGDLQWRGSQSFVVARQPSPSDAAMVKAAGPASSTAIRVAVANPVDVHHLASQDWRQHTAQYLGDKTGKHAFFAARELNKAQIHGTEKTNTQGSVHPVSETRTREEFQESKKQLSTESTATHREGKKRLPVQNGAPSGDASKFGFHKSTKGYRPSHSTAISALDFRKFVENNSCGTPLTQPAIPPLTSSSFLNDPSQVPVLDRAASPLPDMSSAVKYNESKTSMATISSISAPVQGGRSGFRIDDIIEESSIDQKAKDLKRKADEISDVIEQEVRIWASSPPVEVSNIATDMSVLDSQAATPDEASTIARNTNSDTSEHRPAKRLKKFAEVVGYVALGGAAVGAGMFSLLVATAPDFM